MVCLLSAEDVVMSIPYFRDDYVSSESIEKIKSSTNLVEAVKYALGKSSFSVIIEGVPSEYRKRSIEKHLSMVKGKVVSRSSLLEALADFYGYRIENHHGYMFFVQTFRSSNVFPEMTSQEIQHFLRSATKIVSRFDPNLTRTQGIDNEFRNFANTLPPNVIAQWQSVSVTEKPQNSTQQLSKLGGLFGALRTQETGSQIPISSMSPSQQKFLKSLAYDQYVGVGTEQIRRAINMLTAFQASTNFFSYRSDGPLNCFACNYIFNGRNYTVFLSPVSRVFLNFGSSVTIHKPVVGTDPSDPSLDDYDKQGNPKPWSEITKDTVTLRQLAAQVTVESNMTVQIHPALAEKRISLIEKNSKDKQSLFLAIAKLYNLNLRRDDNKLILEPPPVPKITRPEQVAAALDQITPGPVKRLYNGWCEIGSREAALRSANSSPEENSEVVVRVSPQTLKSGMSAVRRAAIRRLRILLDPQITKAKNQRVTWKEIDAEAQWLCRFIFSCEAFCHTFAQSTKGLPDYIQNFGSYQLRGRLYNNQGRSWLRISLRSPDGKNGFSTSGVISKP
jgi:hypothetical protein